MDTVEQAKDRINQAPPSTDDDTLNLLDILLVLVNRRRMIVWVTAASLLAGVILSVLLKPNFTATAIILPPQQQSSSSALLSQLGSLTSLGGGASALGLKSPADMYVGILQSRTIADNIDAQFHLQSVYKLKKLQDTRAALKAHTTIEAGKDGLIQISVTDQNASRASDLANAYVTELYSMNSNLAISEAAQRRVFFDQQLEGEKKALSAAEEDLRATQQKTGLIQLNGQAEMTIRTIAQLRAEIASREVELQSMRTFATEQNPDVNRVQEEISTMRQQLAKLENDQQRQVQPGNISMPAGSLPENSLEYVRKFREVKYHESLFDLLSRQYEAARIDEAKSAPIIQVIDHAIPPDRKSGPHRALIIAGFSVMGFLLAAMLAFAKYAVQRFERRPANAKKLQSLLSQLWPVVE